MCVSLEVRWFILHSPSTDYLTSFPPSSLWSPWIIYLWIRSKLFQRQVLKLVSCIGIQREAMLPQDILIAYTSLVTTGLGTRLLYIVIITCTIKLQDDVMPKHITNNDVYDVGTPVARQKHTLISTQNGFYFTTMTLIFWMMSSIPVKLIRPF